MTDNSPKRRNKNPRRSRSDKYLSIESASLAFAILTLGHDKARLEQLANLAQRRPDIIREFVEPIVSSFGPFEFPNLDDNVIPATREEVIEVIEPVLRDGTRLASFARIFDLYMLRNPPGPDGVVYVLYTIIRFCIARESKPTRKQDKLIWSITLSIAKKSNIGGRHWRELEEKGEVYLSDWIDKVKENGRKRFRTFLNQKARMERSADNAFGKLFSLFFE